MSITAINWAMEQKTDGPSAQAVLFIIADRANEHGVCRHADPDTIAAKTRQSRATVFRRLEELERVAIITRFTRHLEDGRREYEIRFRLDKYVNYRTRKDRTIELFAWEDEDCETPIEAIPYDGRPSEEAVESQFETEGESQIETQPVSPVRLGESHSCHSQESPSKNPSKKDSPLPPKMGGEPEAFDREKVQKRWIEFEQAWREPIGRTSVAQQLWSALTDTERSLVIKAVKGYHAWRGQQKKPPNMESAQTFLRETGAWSGWAAHAPDEKAAKLSVWTSASPEGRAWLALHAVVGGPMPFGFNREPTDQFQIAGDVTPAMLALSELVDERGSADKRGWRLVETGTQKAGAWGRFLHACIGKWPVMREFDGIEGFLAPWPWPPLKDGSLSPLPNPDPLTEELESEHVGDVPSNPQS